MRPFCRLAVAGLFCTGDLSSANVASERECECEVGALPADLALLALRADDTLVTERGDTLPVASGGTDAAASVASESLVSNGRGVGTRTATGGGGKLIVFDDMRDGEMIPEEAGAEEALSDRPPMPGKSGSVTSFFLERVRVDVG